MCNGIVLSPSNGHRPFQTLSFWVLTIRFPLRSFPYNILRAIESSCSSIMAPSKAIASADGKTMDWDQSADVYSKYMPRLVSPPARMLVGWMQSFEKLTASSKVLDVGAGTGVLTRVIHEAQPQAHIVATDLSAGMLDQIEKMDNVETKVLDATNLAGLQDNTFTHVVSTFALQFIPEQEAALNEMRRVLMPCSYNGILALGIWGEIGFRYPWEKAMKTVEPDYVFPDFYTGAFVGKTADTLEEGLKEVGFVDINVNKISAKWDFETPGELVWYFFNSKNAAIERILHPFRNTEKWPRIQEEFEKVVREDWERQSLGMMISEVFLAIARKPAR